MDFQGKNVIVTGGAGGIGREVVNGVIAGGGRAIIVDINMDAARAAQSELGEENVGIYQADLSKPDVIRSVFQHIIDAEGHVDVLVNNAGIVSTLPFEEVTQEEWDKVIGIDLTGVFAGISAVYPHMVERGSGRIVNVASVAAKKGGGLLGTSAYASAKAGVIGLTKAVAREGARKGVRCNAVCPSVTMTPMITKQPKEKQEILTNSVPIGRGAHPKEIANVILFYASELASFVTGEISDADGGVTMDG